MLGVMLGVNKSDTPENTLNSQNEKQNANQEEPAGINIMTECKPELENNGKFKMFEGFRWPKWKTASTVAKNICCWT